MTKVFEEKLWLSSVPLVSVNPNGRPTGMASGCLIDYSGRRILLSVSHATGNGGIWAIQQQYVPGKGAELYRMGGMNFLKRATMDHPAFEDIDFSYAEVPPSTFAKRQKINPITEEIEFEEYITVHQLSLDSVPMVNSSYGFSGLVKSSLEHHADNLCLVSELRVYSGLSYLRTDGNYHYFKLPFKHPGHEHFKGCSGSPILSESGEIVALLCGGNEETSEVWGISLKAYKLPIDILIGNLPTKT